MTEARDIAQPSKWPTYAACLVLLAAAVGVYSNSLWGPFFFDDKDAIVENEHIRQLWPPQGLLEAPMDAPTKGRPLVSLSFAINYAFGELDPRGYHAVNMAIHALAALALFGVVRRTLQGDALRQRFGRAARPIALACALLWAVHPINSECINYVSQRTELLMGLFYLLTLYCAIRSRDARRPGRWQVAAVASCGLGMMCKEVMLTAPLMIVLYDWAFRDKPFPQVLRRRWRLYVGLAATCGIPAVLMALYPRSATVATGEVGPLDYALSQCLIIIAYLRLAVWPHPLVIDYGRSQPPPFDLMLVACGLALAALLGLTIAALRYRPKLGFLGAWFFIILAPTSSFLPIITEVGAERRMYLSMAALVVLAVVGGYLLLTRITPSRKLAAWVGCALAAALAVALGQATVRRNRAYSSRVSIWQAAVAATPDNPRPHNNLAVALIFVGRNEEGAASARRALELSPDYLDARNNLGVALSNLGRQPEAIRHLRRILEVDADYVDAHHNLGIAFVRQGRLADGIIHFRKALEISPPRWALRADAHHYVGLALGRQRRFDEAIVHFRKALANSPAHPRVHKSWADALRTLGRTDEALDHYRREIQRSPESPDSYNNAAWILATRADFEPSDSADAVRLAERAAELAGPGNPAILDTLAAAYANAGQYDRAVAVAQEAIDLLTDTGHSEPAAEIHQRLLLYQQRKPYRQHPRDE